MKSFINYAKNRFLYNLLRLAIVFGLGLIASQFLFIPVAYADTYNYDQFTAQLYDNISGSLSERTTTKGDNYWTGQVGLIAYSSGAAWGFNSPTAIVTGHTYSLTVNFSTNNQSYSDIVFSSINRIGLGTSLSNAKSSYQNATNTSLVYSNNSNGTLQFVFDANSTGSYLVVPFATSYSINLETVYFNNFVISDLGSSSDISQDTINNSLNSQTNEINNYINNSTNTITGAITDVEDSINNTINDNFNSCHDSINLIDLSSMVPGFGLDDGTLNNTYGTVGRMRSNFLKVESNTTYTFSIIETSSNFNKWIGINFYSSNSIDTFIQRLTHNTSNTFTFTTTSDTNYIVVSGHNIMNATKIQLEKGSAITSYEPYGEICTNKIDETNDKLDEAENTRKGIWATIKDLPNQFLNMLKGLFIPEDDFFTNWFDDFMSFVELKLGFLATPFTIFIDFIESYLELDSSTDVIINIPDISVPNFEDNIIVHATTFNWSETLRSKDSLNNLWQLYLDFIDVFLILNFIGLCENVYNRIFGGNTSNYEYYTV